MYICTYIHVCICLFTQYGAVGANEVAREQSKGRHTHLNGIVVAVTFMLPNHFDVSPLSVDGRDSLGQRGARIFVRTGVNKEKYNRVMLPVFHSFTGATKVMYDNCSIHDRTSGPWEYLMWPANSPDMGGWEQVNKHYKCLYEIRLEQIMRGKILLLFYY